MITRDDLEKRIWEIAGRHLTGEQVDALLEVAEAYGIERREAKAQAAEFPVLRHEHETDLYPVIAVLAEALMPGLPQMAARRAQQARSDAA